MLKELILSAILLTVTVFSAILINKSIDNHIKNNNTLKHRAILIKKIINISLIFFVLFVLIILWGLNISNLWLILSSILALIAIAFFAVWSILSNILASLLFFFTGSIKIGDTIIIYPDKIKGRVIDIGAMFVELKDSKGDILHIPNNMLFQRIVKTIKN